MQYEEIKDFSVNEPKVTTNEGSIRDQRRKFKELVKQVFDNAIAQGMNPEDMMYMYSKDNKDYFKNKITKEYAIYMSKPFLDIFKKNV